MKRNVRKMSNKNAEYLLENWKQKMYCKPFLHQSKQEMSKPVFFIISSACNCVHYIIDP